MMPSDSEDEIDPPDGPGSSHIPQTVYVINFAPSARREAVEWLLERVEAKRKYGGAELLVRCEPQRQGQGAVAHVSATKVKLLEIAEATELQKRASNGLMKEFTVRGMDHFLYPGQNLDTLLSPSERSFCVMHELEAVQAKQDESHVPGYPDVLLYPGQSLVSIYQAEGLITNLFPLHDRQVLESLSSKWFRAVFEKAPFGFDLHLAKLIPTQQQSGSPRPEQLTGEEIRSYFGEGVAMYFGFLAFYTVALGVPAILGLAQIIFNIDTLHEFAFYASFNLVWVTLFLEMWKRKCAELSYSWGTLFQSPNLGLRSGYWGDMQQDPITGRYQPYYPAWITRSKVYLVSVPIVLLCVFAALWLMVVNFWAEEQLVDWKKKYGAMAGIFIHMPSAVYAAAVWLMNHYFKKLATALTIYENHRTQADYDWHKVAKLIVFEFVNNFTSLFYIAFYLQDFDQLCSQVATMLIVTQMINHFEEALLPYFVKISYGQIADNVEEHLKTMPVTSVIFGSCGKQREDEEPEEESIPVLTLDPKDPRIAHAKEEADLDNYEDAYDDYLELWIQFGYVFLFSSVYPMAAFWALLNNVLELKTDAFKLCKVLQRPRVKRVNSIGAWQAAFELLGIIAVMTNCALLCLSPRLRVIMPGASPVEWVLLFVMLEHVILGFKGLLAWFVPNKPLWVRQALEKANFQNKQALKSELKKSRRHLSRRFRSVHGVPRSGSRSRGTTPVSQNGAVRNRTPSATRDYRNYRRYDD